MTTSATSAHLEQFRMVIDAAPRDAVVALAKSTEFGGFGASGFGRVNGVDAIREYTENESVWVELTGATRDPFTLGWAPTLRNDPGCPGPYPARPQPNPVTVGNRCSSEA